MFIGSRVQNLWSSKVVTTKASLIIEDVKYLKIYEIDGPRVTPQGYSRAWARGILGPGLGYSRAWASGILGPGLGVF